MGQESTVPDKDPNSQEKHRIINLDRFLPWLGLVASAFLALGLIDKVPSLLWLASASIFSFLYILPIFLSRVTPFHITFQSTNHVANRIGFYASWLGIVLLFVVIMLWFKYDFVRGAELRAADDELQKVKLTYKTQIAKLTSIEPELTGEKSLEKLREIFTDSAIIEIERNPRDYFSNDQKLRGPWMGIESILKYYRDVPRGNFQYRHNVQDIQINEPIAIAYTFTDKRNGSNGQWEPWSAEFWVFSHISPMSQNPWRICRIMGGMKSKKIEQEWEKLKRSNQISCS